MKAFLKWWMVQAFALLLAVPAASAQDRVPFRQEELDQMLAPIALYPDSLLSQVLMASTYPLEVVQAARWSRANPALKGQDAVRAVVSMDWDPSVKSLTAFPQVLSTMDAKLEWTERLGEAFLAQQADVMDTVQGLRRRAEAAGNLESSEQMRVARRGEVIAIDPPTPGVVYVPYYDPLVVYGPWWWPLYPPVFWAPPPAYYVVPAHRPVFFWGSGIVISAGLFFGHFDWPRRHVTVVHVVRHYPQARPVQVRTAWTHDPAHRRGLPFRHPGMQPRLAQLRSGSGGVAPPDRHREFRDAPRPQARVMETQPMAAPSANSGPRPAATAPAVRFDSRQEDRQPPRREARVERRPAHVVPPQQRAVVSAPIPAPPAAVGTPAPAPRLESHRPQELRARGHDKPERRHPRGRDNDRKS